MSGPSETSRRFVILHHATPDGEHWDLMIEFGKELATWRLAQNPSGGDPWRTIPAKRIGDHRRLYLDYEGPLSKGRGHVTRVEAGSCKLLSTDAECWRFRAFGQRFSGAFELVTVENICELRRAREV